MRIGLSNVTLHLVEDRPPANATSPGKLPVDLAIPSLVVARDRSGLFSLQSAGESDEKFILRNQSNFQGCGIFERPV